MSPQAELRLTTDFFPATGPIPERGVSEAESVGIGRFSGETTQEFRSENKNELRLLIDGNDFPPYTIYSPVTETLVEMESHTIEGGDNLYTCIAAASILAKVARDEYIADLCKEYPKLSELYSIDKNKGYGTAAHMKGIKEHGITRWHRKSYGPCKNAELTVNV